MATVWLIVSLEYTLVLHAYIASSTDPSRTDLSPQIKELDKYLNRIQGVLTGKDSYYKHELNGVMV